MAAGSSMVSDAGLSAHVRVVPLTPHLGAGMGGLRLSGTPGPATIDALRGGTPDENAASLRGVLTGDTGPYRDVVLLNAAAALVGGGHEETLTTAAERAADSIADGRAMGALDRLVAITNGEAE